MSLGEELSRLDTGLLAKAISGVYGRSETMEELRRMAAVANDFNPLLMEVPAELEKLFPDASVDELRGIRIGANLAILMLSEYAQLEELIQTFPDVPPVPPASE